MRFPLPVFARAGLACGLFTWLHFVFLGHSPGAGNQSLHLVFLEHLRDPSLYRNDALIGTLARFPTWWFHALARLLTPDLSVPTVLFLLHVATTFATFCGLRGLAAVLWPNLRFPSLVLLPFLFQRFQALAETPLMPAAFSHTSLALALSLLALNLLLRGRLIAAFAMMGLMANVHLLTAAYTGALAGAWLLARWRELSPRQLLAALAAGALPAAPILPLLLAPHGAYDAVWLHLLELRSAHHVFPSSWWRSGDPMIGDYAAALAYLVLAWAWLRPDADTRRALLAFLSVSAAVMFLGLIGGEVLRVPLILRAQLFRVSLYPLILALLAIFPMALSRPGKAGGWPNPLVSAGLIAVWCLPGFASFRMPLLALLAWWVFFRVRLPLPAAALLSAAILVTGWSDHRLSTRFWSPSPPAWPFGIQRPDPKAADAWTEIQALAKAHTPPEARLLTPPRQNGFRVGSQRAIVGEWRDGTMQFFDPAFAVGWQDRMTRMDPARTGGFTAEDWIGLCRELGADFLVLPRSDRLRLDEVAGNQAWMLCRPAPPPPPPLPPPPANALDPEDWLEQERFMVEVVEPNLLRHRTGTLAVQVLDASGRPAAGAKVSVAQKDLRFGIGSALNHFAVPAAHSKEFRAPLVHERELALFPEVFNSSVIGYAGKWSVIEPTRGTRDTRSLDAYVDWCVRHGIRVEFHFVSGYAPAWVEEMDNPAERQSALLAHAGDLIDRYGERIADWQVINEDILHDEIGPVFQLFRDRLPAARLGAGYCTRFFSGREEAGRQQRDLVRGQRNLVQLASSPTGVDFVAAHGHRPFGLWADPRVIYEVFDAYQAQGIRVHVTEFGVPHSGPIEGKVLGGAWNETLQAEYLVRFLKIAYSHPNVDMVNLWGFGPRTWQAHIGLLDEAYEPRPAFHALRDLVRGTWWTDGDFAANREGRVRFTGHHGRYRVGIQLPDGTSWEEELRFAPDQAGPWVFRQPKP